MDTTALMSELIKVLGPIGFILWLVHRTTTHTVPRLAKESMEAQERARQDFKEMLTHQRETFLSEIQREREVYREHLDRIIETIKETGKR